MVTVKENMKLKFFLEYSNNEQISQMRAPLATRCEPAGDQNRHLKMPFVFEHKMLYILIHASYTRIMCILTY